MLFYDLFWIYPCNCHVQFREKIKLSVSVSVSVSSHIPYLSSILFVITFKEIQVNHYDVHVKDQYEDEMVLLHLGIMVEVIAHVT